jgi:hypothetical protein
MPKQPRKKKAAPEPVDVAKELAEALAEKKPPERFRREAAASQRIPVAGERVLRPGSDSEYEITWVAPDHNRVHIGVPRTNFEWRNVDPATLTYLDAPRNSQPTKPAKPSFNAEEIEERIAIMQHESIQHISGEIAVLKKYLKSKHVPEEAAEELDALCKDTEERWQAAAAKIAELLEE